MSPNTYTAEGIDLSWQSTPALWMAVREGLCWCEECRATHIVGLGVTTAQAIAHLLEQESTCATGGQGD